MAGPDLSGPTARVEALMDDEGTVVADRAGVRDDVLDTTTGQMVPAQQPGTVYSGMCMVTPAMPDDGTPAPDEDTGAVARLPRYRLMIPLSADPVERGQLFTVTSSLRDPQLVGQQFRIDAAGQVSTYSVARIIGMERL